LATDDFEEDEGYYLGILRKQLFEGSCDEMEKSEHAGISKLESEALFDWAVPNIFGKIGSSWRLKLSSITSVRKA
jgi:hypothetical protein